ncbi:hypothetical protein MTR67_023030 [Solanum verrucosum]|uniref:Uncharacterized protein n=1 Tax=Solanum verrucosum TaxID=315347 RepID=A0AAF0QVQ3_SOLVR|nr:hypothetical protein MTR67_023030 [Solanum verrucosum]
MDLLKTLCYLFCCCSIFRLYTQV